MLKFIEGGTQSCPGSGDSWDTVLSLAQKLPHTTCLPAPSDVARGGGGQGGQSTWPEQSRGEEQKSVGVPGKLEGLSPFLQEGKQGHKELNCLLVQGGGAGPPGNIALAQQGRRAKVATSHNCVEGHQESVPHPPPTCGYTAMSLQPFSFSCQL